MGKKRPIKCQRCKAVCVEVGHALGYPKAILDPKLLRQGRTAGEYRYACPNCEAEYIHDTSQGRILTVPRGADFHIRLLSGEERIRINSSLVLELWGLPPEKRGIELTVEEARKVQNRVRRIRHRLSGNHLDDDILVWQQFRLTSEEIKKLLGRDL